MKKRIIALAILSAFSVSAYAASEALVVQDGSLNNAQVTQTDNITPTYASVHQTGTSNQDHVIIFFDRFDKLFCRHVNTQVNHIKASAFKHHHDQVFSDIVKVSGHCSHYTGSQ